MSRRRTVVLNGLVSLLLLGASSARAQTCRWDGTSPFCDGECSGNETEITRAGTAPGSPPAYNGPTFGAACVTGTKAYCCTMSGLTCRWDGTAPLCAGECRSGERPGEPPPGSSSGHGCWTGSKVYCCRSTNAVGVGRSQLEANPALTKYAAVWIKGAGPTWQARHGLTSAQHQQAFDTLSHQGYRPVEVEGYAVGDQDTYASIWVQQGGPAWAARHGLTAAQYQQEFDRLVREGYRLLNVSGFAVAGQDRYAAIWEQRQGPPWEARHGMTAAQYQAEFDRLVSQGYRLVDVSGYDVGGQDRYAAIWERSQGPAWVARHGMTSEQYQQEFNRLVQQGYRLNRVRGWRSGDVSHYAAIWEKVAESPAWVARHGMLSQVYQEEFEARAKDGYRLTHVSGYHTYD
jgi:Bacterial tandem repeat domain 1